MKNTCVDGTIPKLFEGKMLVSKKKNTSGGLGKSCKNEFHSVLHINFDMFEKKWIKIFVRMTTFCTTYQ